MGAIRLRRPAIWSAACLRRGFGRQGANEARLRFGSLGVGFRPAKAPSPPALCRRTPKVLRVAYPQDSSVRPHSLPPLTQCSKSAQPC